MTEFKKDPAIPLHIQAENYIRNLIREEEYAKGKLLPNEVELSETMGISRNTLRQAINKLVYEGLLVRKKRFGTQVAKKGIVSGVLSWLSFSEEMKRLGIEVRNYELHVSNRKVTEEVRSFFGRKDPDEKYLCLERVRGSKDYPFVYFISYFNPNIKMRSNEDFSQPLYEIMRKELGITVKRSCEQISARLALDETLAERLEITTADPILIRKRLVYDENGTPIEFNIGYYRSDSFSYTVDSVR